MNIWGALVGTVIGIPLVYFLREDGIVPSLIAVAATSVATCVVYCHRIRIEQVTVSSHETRPKPWPC